MSYFADVLMMLSALAACIYCIVLSKKLNSFKDTKDGVGGAVATLNAQVLDLNKAMQSAQSLGHTSQNSLDELTKRAEHVAQRLELLVAAMHDLPDHEEQNASTQHTLTEPVFSHAKLKVTK